MVMHLSPNRLSGFDSHSSCSSNTNNMEWKIITKDYKGEAGVITGVGPLDQLMKMVKIINHNIVSVFKIENGKEIEVNVFSSVSGKIEAAYQIDL